MNAKEFIASGILEQYVLGQVTPQERAEVLRYAHEFPEVQAELNAIELALEKYLTLQGIPASGNLESNVLKKINPNDDQTPPSSFNNNTSPPSGPNWLGLLLGVALLASIIGTYMLYQSNRQLQNQLTTINTQLQTLQNNCNQIQAENDQLQQKIQILQNIDNQSTILKEPNNANTNQVAVYWNQQTQKSYLNVLSLPAPPANRVYQLWAIVDGNPVDMGLVEVDANSTAMAEVPFIANPQAFAITLETGRQPTPDLTNLVVFGNV